MDVAGVTRAAEVAQTTPAVPAEVAAENRDVVQAVKALNSAELFGGDSELMFQRDPRTQRMIVRVVDRKTREVISQIPPEYVLRLAEDLKNR